MEKQKNTTSDMEIRTMGKKFLRDRLSAAGFSYVVTKRSRKRKIIRSLLLLSILTFMITMTVNVTIEYLTYPKVLITEVESHLSLEFPAVTICSTSPISRKDSKNVSAIAKFQRILKGANRSNPASLENFHTICDNNPMCHWSWFTNVCHCAKTPCLSGLCFFEGEKEICACEEQLCEWPYLQRKGACKTEAFGNVVDKSSCRCKSNFNYTLSDEDPDFQKKMDEMRQQQKKERDIDDPEIQKYAELLRKSKTDDLSDVFEELLPDLQDDVGEVDTNKMIVSCSYERLPCTRNDFRVLLDPMLGECFMFNYIGNNAMETAKRIYNYGGSSGLQIILNARSVTGLEKVDLLSPVLGFQVVIHNPRHTPLVLEHASLLRKGAMTSIGVTKSTIERLGKPFGDCKSDTMEDPYVQLDCRKSCRFENVMIQCSCMKRSFMPVVLFNQTKEERYCSSNKEDVKCIENVISDIENNKILCDCPAACNEKSFLTSMENSKINNEFYRSVQGIKTMKLHKKDIKTLRTQARNFTGLKVYYQTLRVDKCTEISAYSWDTLVANIGGNLGFFMGLSVITFFELFEFIWEILVACFRRCRTQTTVVNEFRRR